MLAGSGQWKIEEKAFQCSKKVYLPSPPLVHFDPTLLLILAYDVSEVGIGAMLVHRIPDGGEQPIGYVSQSLTKAESNYSQLAKEGLLCVFGMK